MTIESQNDGNRGPNAQWPDRYLFTHGGRWPTGKAAESKFAECSVRNTRCRLVNNTPDKKWELYEIKKDLGEVNNIAAQNKDVVGEMEDAYDKW